MELALVLIVTVTTGELTYNKYIQTQARNSEEPFKEFVLVLSLY